MQSILLIEDNADNRDLIHAFLDGEFEVESVEDGYQALSVLEDDARVVPDLVLCDIALPGLDGVEVLVALSLMGDVSGAGPLRVDERTVGESRKFDARRRGTPAFRARVGREDQGKKGGYHRV